jgi:hypothetical protein
VSDAVMGSVLFYRRDAPTPPPMVPLPPLPPFSNQPLNTPSKPDHKSSSKPSRLRTLLQMNYGTPKKQTSALNVSGAGVNSPASFIVGRKTPSPEKEDGLVFGGQSYGYDRSTFKEREGRRGEVDLLPPRPGTSLGTYTPREKKEASPFIATAATVSDKEERNEGLPSGRSGGVMGLPQPQPRMQQGKGKMSLGPGRVPPPRPSSRPSLVHDNTPTVKGLGGRPSLSELREKAISPPPGGKENGGQQRGMMMLPPTTTRPRFPLIPRVGSNVSMTNTPLSSANWTNGPNTVGEKRESPSEDLPFKNGAGDGWGTPYPASDLDGRKGKKGGYPFPVVPLMIPHRASSKQAVEGKEEPTTKARGRSRFDSSAFEYQAFETETVISRSGGGGLNQQKENTIGAPSVAPTGSYNKEGNETIKSMYKRSSSRLAGFIAEKDEDKENKGESKDAKMGMSWGRSRPLPAVLTGGRGAMRG